MKFNIKDVNGNVLFVVDTAIYPEAKPHNCRIVEPSENVVTSYKGFYLIAKRRRNRTIIIPYNWVPITHEYYDMFVSQGAKVVEPDSFIINYVDNLEGV